MNPGLAPPQLLDRLRDQARDLGFDLFGVAPAVTPHGFHRLVDWIESGYAAEMHYFRDRLPAYADPNLVLAGVRSLIVLSYPYAAVPASSAGTSEAPGRSRPLGKIARYACDATDYHDRIHPLLEQLKQTIRGACPDAQSRGVVDTAPLLEREFAQAAGLGWAGKNSLLLNKHRGSYFFLACLLTTLDLPPSTPHATAHCGTCTRCLDACPTDAFPAPGVVDSRRCISYLTIEHRGPIPLNLRPGLGDWLFGCDVCQEVCPWNRHASRQPHFSGVGKAVDTPAADLVAARPSPPHATDLIEILNLDEAGFRARFRDTPLWRPRRRGILRNAAICLGNARDPAAAPCLIHCLGDSEPLIRGAAAWALGQLGGQHIALRARQAIEPDPQVREEIAAALQPSAISDTAP